MTRDMWHVTHDTWEEGNFLQNCQLSSSYGLGETVFWRYFHKGWLTVWKNQWQRCLYNSPGFTWSVKELDGVGPIAPPTGLTTLKKTGKKTCDMWHMTHDRWGKVNLLSKFQLRSFHGLGLKVFWRYFHKGWLTDLLIELMNEWMTKGFVEQPRLHWIC